MKTNAATLAQLEAFQTYNVDGTSLLNPEYRTYEEGEFLFHDGAPARYLYFLVQGEVLTYLSGPNNGKMSLGVYKDKGILDVSTLFLIDGIFHYEALCKSTVTCLALPIEKNRKPLQDQLLFMQECAIQLSGTLDQTRNYFYIRKFPLERRLCSYIAFTRTSQVWNCNKELTAKDLHTTVRHVERTLDSLCARGILSKEENFYRVKDVERFEKMNDGSFYAKRNKYGEIIRNTKKKER